MSVSRVTMEYYNLDQLPYERPSLPPSPALAREKGRGYRFITSVLTVVLMFATWILLSGRMDFYHLGLGAVSSILVTVFSRDLLFASGRLDFLPRLPCRFTLIYIPWLLWQVLLANLHVLFLVLSPGMMKKIDPHMVMFRTRLKDDLAVAAYANSITLTPGTITVYAAVDGRMTVHAIDRPSGDREALKKMEDKVAMTFGEE